MVTSKAPSSPRVSKTLSPSLQGRSGVLPGIAVRFAEEGWALPDLDQRAPHREVKEENYGNWISLGKAAPWSGLTEIENRDYGDVLSIARGYVFTWRRKTRNDGARRTSLGSEFHRLGATAEKALLRVLTFLISFMGRISGWAETRDE
uniref:KRAB domain-containing protein n=1 Tax=Varanus komodoensis TaxID=61221 RepID=A0A8D2ILV3_VARKO